MEEKRLNCNKNADNKIDENKSGEELLNEYFNQGDKDRFMGYSVYAQTHNDGCCC